MGDSELTACRIPAFLRTYRPARLGTGDPGLGHHGAVQATAVLADAWSARRWARVEELVSRSGGSCSPQRLRQMPGAERVEGIDVLRVTERSAALAEVDAVLRVGHRSEAMHLLWGFEDDAGCAVVPCLETGTWRLRDCRILGRLNAR